MRSRHSRKKALIKRRCKKCGRSFVVVNDPAAGHPFVCKYCKGK